jgi:YD repeat-containing protein
VKTSKVATGSSGAESAVSRTEVYDAFGRLIEVKEPSGTNGAVVTTKYRYDVGNRLTRVETTSGSVTQVRTFAYDGLGQLRSESHPELGPAGNGSKVYDFYDVLGNPGTATIGGTSGAGLRAQVYRYDPAGRLIEVFDGRDLDHPLKQYFYSRTNASGANKTAGKLVRTIRHHPELGYRVAEAFEYSEPGGRLSAKTTRLTGSTSPDRAPAFTQNYTYNSLGELASITYPDCSSGDSACTGATTSRTVGYEYDRGLLSKVPGWAPEIDYSANGRLARVLHGNGVEEIQKNDEDGQLRPQNIQVKKGPTVHWDTSKYLYDGTGNIKAIGTETFKYDGVSRLVEGRVLQAAPSTFQTEALSFDAFGNLTNRSVSNAPNSAPAVNPATNRLTGVGRFWTLRRPPTDAGGNHDGLGQLRSETHPELGPAGNGGSSTTSTTVGQPGVGDDRGDVRCRPTGAGFPVRPGGAVDRGVRRPGLRPPAQAGLLLALERERHEQDRGQAGAFDPPSPGAWVPGGGGVRVRRAGGLNFSLPPSYTYRGPRTH